MVVPGAPALSMFDSSAPETEENIHLAESHSSDAVFFSTTATHQLACLLHRIYVKNQAFYFEYARTPDRPRYEKTGSDNCHHEVKKVNGKTEN